MATMCFGARLLLSNLGQIALPWIRGQIPVPWALNLEMQGKTQQPPVLNPKRPKNSNAKMLWLDQVPRRWPTATQHTNN